MNSAANCRKDIAGFWHDTGKSGITSWIFSTDHKRIGLLYFYSVLGFFLIGRHAGTDCSGSN